MGFLRTARRCDSRQLAGGASLARLHRANCGGTLAHHAEIAFVWHGWSPDGKCWRSSATERRFDIYAIPAAGGEEKQLTTAKGWTTAGILADGEYIYFNSDAPGICNLADARDGSEQETDQFGEENDWVSAPSRGWAADRIRDV